LYQYDWRLPLPHLETRDKVFTELKATIERMVKKNDMKIIILAHSMGNRYAVPSHTSPRQAKIRVILFREFFSALIESYRADY
jgi:hypothetical protein